MIKIPNDKKLEQGATLMELVIAVTILAFVVATTSTIFSTTVKEQRVLKAQLGLMDNARYVLEFMNKELRMAKSVDPAYKDDVNFTEIRFVNSASHNIRYYYDGGAKRIVRNDSTAGTGDQPISSSEITVNKLNFNINNWDLTNGPAPAISIFLEAQKIGASFSHPVILDLQSSVSPRLY